MKYYLSVDVGASSGRLILGCLENGLVKTEEVHRFENKMAYRNGFLCWDLEKIVCEIIRGMKKCAAIGKIPVSVGVDTWGVDFVLTDTDGKIIGDAVAYRDDRTWGMDAAVFEIIPEAVLYNRAGIHTQLFNTIFQLVAVREKNPEHLRQAAHLLMIPDYLHYRLCGVMSNEYTNASTSGLINAHTRRCDAEILERLGLPDFIFGELETPGKNLGRLLPEIAAGVGYDCAVVLPATHDTASAVIAASGDGIFISSGTWSVMGVETDAPICTEECRLLQISNEGGYAGTLLLKNIMGMWMIQRVREEMDNAHGYDELCRMAECAEISSVVDCRDSRFFAPQNMTAEIKAACAGQTVPQTPGELASVVYRSLAECYAQTALELERMTGKIFGTIHIIGGGAKADYLNKLTAERTGKTVIAGPAEATAIGNLAAQMLADGVFTDLTAARECINHSFGD